MEPYTPHTRSSRKKTLGLSSKEYTKIAGTIASVRRNRMAGDEEDSRESNTKDSSFIAETSFVRAPLNSRVAANYAHPRRSSKGKAKQESLDRVPLEIQEALILEDLLFVLMGIEGEHITYHPDYSPEDDDPLRGIQFVVSPYLGKESNPNIYAQFTETRLDSSLRDLVDRILPLGTYYTAIHAFIENRSHMDFGLINHALCAAIRDMLKDYQTLLSQLEHAFNTSPQFSLQKLWFYVHPTIHTLSLIYQLILDLDDTGGSISSSESSSSEDEEERARNEALGLGGAGLKVVMSEFTKGDTTPAGANGIYVKGGEVLTIIYEKMQYMAGDPTAHTIYKSLLRAAAKPYVEMLRTWVTTGKLVDPYEELLVKESKFIDRGILEVDYTDEYWERRYTLRDGSSTTGSKRHMAGVPPPRPSGRLPGGACIPPLLEGWKHKILLAGKYLNVIRECGNDVNRDDLSDEELFLDEESFYTFIENAYSFANKTLLNLLLKDQELIPRLRSLKRYFFLSQASFLTHLLDLSATELRKASRSASIVKLQSLLDLALNNDALGEDALYREDVKVTMADSGLYDFLLKVVNVSGVIGGEEEAAHQEEPAKKEKEEKKSMQAIDALTLDYTVKFPLSLVISRKTILRYQLLFRFLLHLKHVEQSLSSMWIEQKTTPWRCRMPHHPDFERWRLRVCLLRTRMLAFIQQILAFATFEVLEPNWRNLAAKLEKVTTVDQLLRDHVDFLDTCLKECMLTSSKLLKAYSRLILTCSTFALYTASFTKTASNAIAVSENGEEDQGMAKRWDVLGKFETNFNHWFQIHLDCVQFYASSENVSLLPLVVRLNSVKAAS
ncbi:gamma-tubulin complex component 2 [Coprinopsis cinerea okayama7|uniref:Spindle pole body component n=1 Tax=Coprinopsis cinerea (strain Okayama-7 / 130 / ATCC MYA-4618 / FGSC 9003) TaxID=240176 RepID=D6RQU2_COPC7|nr:gamma-tubulin complex component 2 [Coprinopsis cinerea okayama7\|eukprot:XP_002910163.1 gamma-tubulin complex component 2 [Coprinopsis cinerea okayama7\